MIQSLVLSSMVDWVIVIFYRNSFECLIFSLSYSPVLHDPQKQIQLFILLSKYLFSKFQFYIFGCICIFINLND